MYGTLGCLRRYRPPPAPGPARQAELCCGWALPAAIPRSRDPRAPPLFAPRSFRDTPRPRSGGARRVPAPGDRSAGWRRAAAAPEPAPPPPLGLRRTRPPSSVLAVSGRGQAPLPASPGGGDAPGPSDRARPATPGSAGGPSASPASPARSARPPTPPPLLPAAPNALAGARFTLGAPPGQAGARGGLGGGRGGVTRRRRTTSGSAGRF